MVFSKIYENVKTRKFWSVKVESWKENCASKQAQILSSKNPSSEKSHDAYRSIERYFSFFRSHSPQAHRLDLVAMSKFSMGNYVGLSIHETREFRQGCECDSDNSYFGDKFADI